MERQNDMPPTHTVKPMEPPPDSASPTSAQLKGDIDSGKTGDKTELHDPGLAPLGTDEEAAGTPPNSFQVRLARAWEGVRRWSQGAGKHGYAHAPTDMALVGFLSAIAEVGIVIVAGMALVR